jgi:hypothetical protein
MTPAQVLLETSGGCCQRSESGTADEEGSRAGRISLPALRASVEWVMSHLILMDDKQDGASSVVITAHPRHGLRASGFIRVRAALELCSAAADHVYCPPHFVHRLCIWRAF